MRVLSFIPAVVLAAASFVAAAPAATSCVPATGNDAPLQPFINTLVNATAQIQPLSDQLSAQSGAPDAAVVDHIVAQLTGVIQATVGNLQGAASVQLSGLDLTNLGGAVFNFLSSTLGALNIMMKIVIKLGVISVGLKADITALLNATIAVVGSFHPFVAFSLSAILGPLIVAITTTISLMVTLVAQVSVSGAAPA